MKNLLATLVTTSPLLRKNAGLHVCFKLSVIKVNDPLTVKSLLECTNYKFLNEPDRSKTYNKSSPVVCDVRVLGWYRFGGGAGDQMPECCVSVGHCGTHAPGWLNGSHPSVADGAVKRKVCFHWPSFCCLFQLYITVRNCGAFYVYKLIPPHICDSRYCGNGLTPTTGSNAIFHVARRLLHQIVTHSFSLVYK